MKTVRLQLLLKTNSRDPRGMEEAHAAAVAAGMKTTASGLTTMSAEVTPNVFRRLFPTANVEAAVGGTSMPQTLVVPPELEHVVEQISIAPPHLYLE